MKSDVMGRVCGPMDRSRTVKIGLRGRHGGRDHGARRPVPEPTAGASLPVARTIDLRPANPPFWSKSGLRWERRESDVDDESALNFGILMYDVSGLWFSAGCRSFSGDRPLLGRITSARRNPRRIGVGRYDEFRRGFVVVGRAAAPRDGRRLACARRAVPFAVRIPDPPVVATISDTIGTVGPTWLPYIP